MQNSHHCGAGVAQACFHLLTAALAQQTPSAEVLAVVGQQVIAIFAQTAASTGHRSRTRITSARLRLYRYAMAAGEILERGFFHGAGVERVAEAGVVDDTAFSNIDPVVGVPLAFRYEMRARQVGIFQAADSWLDLRVHGRPRFGVRRYHSYKSRTMWSDLQRDTHTIMTLLDAFCALLRTLSR